MFTVRWLVISLTPPPQALPFPEHHLQYGELHKHRYAHHDERSDKTVHAKAETQCEEDYVKQEIDGVTA